MILVADSLPQAGFGYVYSCNGRGRHRSAQHDSTGEDARLAAVIGGGLVLRCVNEDREESQVSGSNQH